MDGPGRDAGRLRTGLRGLLDGDRRITFQQIPRRTAPVRVLRWFSRGWLRTVQQGTTLYAADLRFRLGPLAPDAPLPYAFVFRLFEEDGRWMFRQEGTGLALGPVLRRTACRALDRPCGEAAGEPDAMP